MADPIVPTVTKTVTAYEVTVGDFFVDFMNANETGYEGTLKRCPEIKTLKVQPDSSNKKIYASGKVRDVLANVRGATLALDVVALPAAFVDKARGVVSAGQATSYEVAIPKLPPFGCGFTTEDADGKEVYYWCPYCKMTITDEEHNTSDDQDADPTVSYEIEAMPTDEKIWRVKYRTADAGQNPLTAEAFFKKEPRTIAEVNAIEGA